MPRERFDYFSALERQGEFACEEALMLVALFKDFDPGALPDQASAMHEIENAADQQNHELFTHIAIEFLTPIDREDIAEMAQRLDDIVDYIEDVPQQLYMFNIQKLNPYAQAMAEIIQRATLALVAALKEFRHFKKTHTLSDRIIEINDLEEEADKLYSRSIRDLYVNHADDPVYIMSWSNVFLRMERCIDACENVADMMGTIVLKNT
ncbi:MAG: DUF47 family protein [Coriobacteriaceae bacterium]|jgi:uncharacterized protein Yka (UPF0111/DUF47 family)|nr:DUF47 family protein [Coriobacteriaceae bacterium]